VGLTPLLASSNGCHGLIREVRVGFSVNEAPFLIYTDNRTAEANYEFLQEWFSAFAPFQSNDFWITGESYAGHYIPTLVDRILAQEGVPGQIPLQLQGIAIGNPSTDFKYDTGKLYDDYL
jgi:carboxypeptidase C (cathepsin A)